MHNGIFASPSRVSICAGLNLLFGLSLYSAIRLAISNVELPRIYTSSMNLFFFSFVFQLFVRSAMLLIDDSEFFAQQIIDNQFEFHFRPLIHSAYESKCVRWITAFIAADRSINHWFQYLVSVCEKFFPVSILALQIEAHNLTMRRKNFEVPYAIYLNRSVSSCICPRAPSLDRPKIGCVRSSL